MSVMRRGCGFFLPFLTGSALRAVADQVAREFAEHHDFDAVVGVVLLLFLDLRRVWLEGTTLTEAHVLERDASLLEVLHRRHRAGVRQLPGVVKFAGSRQRPARGMTTDLDFL